MSNDSKDLREASSEQLAGLLKELLGPHDSPEMEHQEERNTSPNKNNAAFFPDKAE